MAQLKLIETRTAEEFWDALSPQRHILTPPTNMLFRGQADERWDLTPSVLRHNPPKISDNQVFTELSYLRAFVAGCDASGLAVPNDSREFRAQFLEAGASAVLARAFINTGNWPPKKMFELLALAQHYRVPTRLLDWSTRSYVAAYFAVSDALALAETRDPPEKMAVWALDIERKGLFHELEVVSVPGSNNANLAAQGGRFTLLRQSGMRGQEYEGHSAIDSYFEASPLSSPLAKITVPCSEAKSLLHLCSLYGISGAVLFPGYEGAARSARDLMRTALHLL